MAIQKTDSTLETIQTWALYVFAFAMPFSIALTQIAIGVAALAWLMRLFWLKTISFERLGLEWAFLLFVLAALVSTIFSTNVPQSVIFLKRHLLIPIVYIVATSIKNRRLLLYMLFLFALSTALYSVTGIVSYFMDPSLRVRHVHNSMTAGGITMLGALVGWGCALCWHDRLKWFFLASGVINLFCLILTSTRGSWLGFGAGLLIIMFMANKKLLLTIPVMVAIVLLLQPAEFSHRVQHMFDPTWRTNAKRIHWWSIGWEIFKDHPVVGIGDVSTQTMYKQYAPPHESEGVGHFHSNYVHIAVIMGTIGLIAFLNMMITLMIRLVQRLKTGFIKYSLGWASVISALSAWVAFNINGFFEWNYGDQEVITILWFLIGLGFITLSDSNNSKEIYAHTWKK
jgi:O-antigen ligase